MSFLIANMHQIRYLLGLRPRPRWRNLQHSPDFLAGFKGPTSKGRKDGRGEGSGGTYTYFKARGRKEGGDG